MPVAGFVMLYGLPAALIASLLPGTVAVVVMAPATLGTKWVSAVARCRAVRAVRRRRNVALVLAVVGVGLRRLRTWWRLGATLAVIAWFAVITRLEPSVLRASCMAALAALGFALGRDRSPLRLLLVTVMILAAADPLLV